jgi:hypothetical protein
LNLKSALFGTQVYLGPIKIIFSVLLKLDWVKRVAGTFTVENYHTKMRKVTQKYKHLLGRYLWEYP